ncbi:ankyrin repeat and LEM domain-containing protein 1 [Rhinoderma darwinii]|uniref:ankyrin repeat and LEM domain-containing protein 1 n=1 Tax=Rhinoderma darwinii TaxID=43563 RepID=UPI003F674EFA
MEDLAGKLCEAVENEDAKEVENLLKCGADSNLVLPNGIAAIHLASGKESECALRCLTLILQHGGNPNVRSTDDLTPVHVAASWGCCKALVFLLRKGGDPSIRDQDGNTALDLALIENNRRCVVALQEYKERLSDRYPGWHKSYSASPDDLAEMSCITLLLESTCEISPFSSTKISPMMSFPKTVDPGNNMDDAVIASRVDMPVLHTKDDLRKEEEISRIKIKSNNWELKPTETKVEVPVIRTSQSRPCSENFSTDVTFDNSSISKNITTSQLVDYNWENNNRNTVNEAMTLNNPLSRYTDSAVKQNLKSNRELDLNDLDDRTDFQVFGKQEGLDVTTPDHVYTYNIERNGDNLEKTLIVCGNVSERENLEESEACIRMYSCQGDCNTSLWDSGDRGGASGGIGHSSKDSNDIFNQSKEDATVLSNNYMCKTMSTPSLELGLACKAVENKAITGAYTQTMPNESKGILLVECTNKTVRTSEMTCTKPSQTLPVTATISEHGSQDLQIQLRKLLLLTKSCHRTGSEAVCPDTIPVTSVKKSLKHNQEFNPNVKDVSFASSSSSEDTLMVESAEHHVNGKGDSELHEDFKKMMLATKNFQSPSTKDEDKSPFFTPRTKSRLNFFKFRQNISSLFDDCVEMPKRGRRVRSPDGRLASSTPDLPDELLPSRSSCSPIVLCEPIEMSNTSETINNAVVKNSSELTFRNKVPQNPRENLSEPETTLSISNFLTDDLSSETEFQSCLQLKQATSEPCSDGGIFESAWLTEDGDSDISVVVDHKNRSVSSTKNEKSLPASLFNGTFLHSTLIEDTVNSCKALRYSFSRLSCIPKADESTVQSCRSTVHYSASQEVPLSPGGRPVNGSQVEPVEYLYKDNEKGHVLIEKHMPSIDRSSIDTAGSSASTIIYDWRNCKINSLTINKACSINSPNRVAVELYRLSNDEISSRLEGLGEDPRQVNSQNRKMCILLLDRRLKEQASNRPAGLFFEYSPELSLALHTSNIPDCNKDEAQISLEFDQPDKTRKWREGVLKSSFNYLLLDPRVTRNLPSRCRDLSQPDCFRTFVSAVFYVGKGKRSRPYCHLYEALTHYKGIGKQPCSKVQHILDIWKSGQGVLSLHCFQNTIPVEAYTREASMVDAIGLKMLTNQKKGVYYGAAQTWTPTRRRRLGVHMLYKAMQIFLAEGERQLRPPDIRSGQR